MSAGRIALIDRTTGKRVRYEELWAMVVEDAVRLEALGVQKGDRLALIVPNGLDYFRLLFAAGFRGAVFVPLNTRLAPREWKTVLDDARPTLLLFADRFSEVAHATGLVGDEQRAMRTMSLGDFWGLAVTKRDEAWHTVGEPPWEMVQSSDPWVMLYTGGSTGKPKGVLLTHDNILWNAINTVASWQLAERDVTYTIMPLFHSGGLNALSMPLLYAGGAVVLDEQFDPDETWRVIAEERVTIILLVPTMHQALLRSPLFKQVDLSHDPIFLSGGAPCPLSIYDAYAARDLKFKEGYGLTEAGPNNFYLTPEEARRKRGSVGRPMLHNRITLIDDGGQPVPPGAVGEIVIEGPHVFLGYWENETETRHALRDGRLYTGDLGRVDEDGYYYIVGRKKEMIISGGENIYPLEIETVLAQHPCVQEAVVVGVPDAYWGERAVAFVVPKQGAAIDEGILVEHCRAHLARYKTPKEFVFLEALPKTSVGKIDKKALKDAYASRV
ncbi:MAG: Long-chain-fatty-acid--CoA ligase [Candidatus Carbobacillus altaicus]|uniref:Long-chain-fatty-acid--CoA ligase n=1 Tax=Candidatus Carbonibacillus altaicus TaxID=2163959 RepID=A0A2R6Y201_9BACL|nr:MAG: Long-chain-fatty-acid--CoA ligase [Candidatus Carbobacillus altaicus]